MNRRDFSAIAASALALGFPQMLLAKANEAKLKENENLKLPDKPLTFRKSGKSVQIDWLLVVTPCGVMGVDTRQPVPMQNEKRISLTKAPLLGSLFKEPLTSKNVSKMRVAGPVFINQNTLVAFPDVCLTPKSTGAIPIPYPNYGASFRPGNSFKKVRVTNPPAQKSFENRKPDGVARLSGKLVVFELPGVQLPPLSN